MKKKNIAVISIVSALIFLALSCMPAETVVIKGDLTRLDFTAPGLFYALADHEYARGEYRVTAHYSTGYQEDVTASATIKGDEYVVLTSNGGLTFKSCYTDDHSCYKNNHKYTVTASYEGKTTTAAVYAYRAGDYLSFTVKSNPTKFFEGTSLLTPGIVEISYKTETGMYASTSLPKSGFVTIYGEDGNESESGTLETIRPLQKGDSRITYSVYKDSEARSINIKVLPLTEGKAISLSSLTSYPKEGEEIDLSKFEATYMKNYRVRLYDNEDEEKAEARFLMYATDENGEVKEGYRFTVTVFRNGETKTSGTFEKGDTITIKVEYKISEDTTLTGTRDFSV